MRDRVRAFIEELIEGELEAVLARPRYGRRAKDSGCVETSAGIVGHRHGSRTRTLTGTFGRTEIAVPRARLMQPDGGTTEWKSKAAARLSAAHACGRGVDRERLSCRHQHAPRPACACRAVRRRGRQGHGEPDLAQGEGRLGRLERPFARRRADRAADPRRHGRARAARPQGDLDLAAGRHRRARRRAEGAARGQEHGRRKRRGLARGARRSDPARPAAARVPHRRRRGRARQGDRRRVGRRAGSALHRAQASQSARPCARAPARGDHGRLHRHDLRGDAARRSRRAARPSSANGGSSIAPSPTAWRKPATRCSPSLACRRASGRARAPRTPSNGCTKSSSGGSRRRPCCRPPKPPPCCSGRCSPQGRSRCAKSTAGRRSPPRLIAQPIDLAA